MRALAIIFAALALSCSQARNPRLESGPERIDLYRALVQFAAADLHENGLPYSVCFLEVDGHDPSVALLAELDVLDAPVLVASKSTRRESPSGEYEYVDRSTGRTGVLIAVSIQKVRTPEEVEASFGWDQAGQASRSASVLLRRRDGKWVISETRFLVQS